MADAPGRRVSVAVATTTWIADGIKAHLGRMPDDFEVVGETTDPALLPDLLMSCQPDLVLLATPFIRAIPPELAGGHRTKVVVFLPSSFTQHDVAEMFYTFKPAAMVPVDMHMDDLIRVLLLASRGMVIVPAAIERPGLVPLFSRGSQTLGLSLKELEVLQWLANGFTDREAAVRLGISERTLHTHLDHVKAKLRVGNRAHAIAIAAAAGLVFPSLPSLPDASDARVTRAPASRQG